MMRFSRVKIPTQKTKLLKIENGSHVLLSKYVKTDKELIERELIQFIKDSTGAEEVKKSKKSKR